MTLALPPTSPRPAPCGSRVRASLAVLLVGLLAFAGVRALAGPPRGLRVASGASSRAAVAFRDDVDALEKLLTWAYVAPRLERAYDAVWTVTERPGKDARGEILDALRRAADGHQVVDLFLLAHGNDVIDSVETLPRTVTSRIRLAYDSGCTDGRHGPRWTALGVGSFVGHPESAAHAPFLYEFLRHWIAGRSLREAVAEGNRFTTTLYDRLSPAGLSGDAVAWSRSHAAIAGAPDLRIGDDR